MTQYEVDLNRAEDDGPTPSKTAGTLSTNRGLTSTFQAKEKQKAAHYLGVENADLLNGIVNNEVLIPSTYFEKTLEQRLEDKNKMLDKMSKLMNEPIE